MHRMTLVAGLLCLAGLLRGADMPKEDVIDVPAIGEGLCVHNLFQSNMVLQRDKPIAVWGWAAPGEKVTVTFADQTQTATTAEDRSWKVALSALPANATPAKMTIQGGERTLVLENILVGDVWVLGGQSNMEFPISNVENGKLEIVSARFDQMRILTVPTQGGPEVKAGFPRLYEWSSWSGRHFRKGDWDVCSPETVRELSAIGYVFARRIHMATKIPIGVIDASRGGTTVETWTPPSVLKEIDTPEVKALLAGWDQKIADWDPKKDLETRVQNFEKRVADMKTRGQEIPQGMTAPTDLRPGPSADPNRPGTCYNCMIAPIAGIALKGAIFHQGYNTALGCGSSGAAMYHQIFGRMISAWRAAFNDPAMPFGIISLCTAGPPQSLDDYVERMLDDGIYIREAQYKTFLDFYNAGDKNIGFVSSYDQRKSWYHPQIKIPVGERAARWALATQYGLDKELQWKPPMVTGMKVEDGKIVLTMDTDVAAADDGPIVGFAIAGQDRRFQPARAEYLQKGTDSRNRPQYDRKVLVLSSPHVPEPVHYRFAWGRNPLANLQAGGNIDLPLATQRSDDWKLEDVPLDVLGGEPLEEGRLSRQQRGKIQQVLRLEDIGRRLKDAQAYIDEHKEKYEQEKAKEKK